MESEWADDRHSMSSEHFSNTHIQTLLSSGNSSIAHTTLSCYAPPESTWLRLETYAPRSKQHLTASTPHWGINCMRKSVSKNCADCTATVVVSYRRSSADVVAIYVHMYDFEAKKPGALCGNPTCTRAEQRHLCQRSCFRYSSRNS